MDDAGPQSLFVVVSYKQDYKQDEAPYFCSILQLETQVNNHEYAAHLIPEQIKKTQVNEKEYVARFSVPHGCPSISWLFSPPTSSTEDLYMVPDWTVGVRQIGAPLRGCKFNFRNGMCRPIMPPRASKFYGRVVNQRGHIYFMAHPDWYYDTPDPVFECYDPDENKWKALEPFPDHAVHQLRCSIEATAVWDDTILYNMGGSDIWAYNVPKDKWYIVDVEDDRCYTIVGEAVVLENTIYALTTLSLDLVLALSIEREEVNGDLVFKCSLRSEISVPGMEKKIKFEDKIAHSMTRHFVHLGKDNFCLVQSCNHLGLNRYQPIQLTSIKLKGEKSMTVTNICVYEVEIQSDEQFQMEIQRYEQFQAETRRYEEFQGGIQPDQQFRVRLCFSLPEFKTTALKEGKQFAFDVDPFPEDYASKKEDKTDFNPESEVVKPVQDENVTLPKDEEGHSIYVRNLPPDATFRQLKKALKKFGAIKRDGIRVILNNTGNPYAFVEFESAASKQLAVKASAIIIMGCRAVIEEKRRGFFPVDCNRTSGSSSSGKNKFKNHGDVSRSKTICGGHNVGEGGGSRRPKGVWK